MKRTILIPLRADFSESFFGKRVWIYHKPHWRSSFFIRITRVFLGVHYSRRMAKRLRTLSLPFLPPRKRRGESRALGVVVFIEDFLFCACAGIALVLLFYGANNGKFRFSALLCTGAGFLLYRVTLGRLVMLFSVGIAFLIATTVRYLIFFFLYPIPHNVSGFI